MVNARKPISGGERKEQWLDAALDVLDDEGIEGVKVERLARHLKVTKGSFYWHFKDRQELLGAMVNFWECAQEEIIRRLEGSSAPDPKQRLWELLKFIMDKDSRHDVAMRGWARVEPNAAQAVDRIDKRRLEYCENLFRNMGFGVKDAKMRARLVYFYQVGEYTVVSRDDHKLRMELAKCRYDLFTAPVDTS